MFTPVPPAPSGAPQPLSESDVRRLILLAVVGILVALLALVLLPTHLAWSERPATVPIGATGQ